jgi:hypothetical protein
LTFRITEIWAFTSIDEGGEEGIIGMRTPVGSVPFIAADKTRLEELRPHATKIAMISRRDVHLSRFSVREDIERITPPPPPAAREGYTSLANDLEHELALIELDRLMKANPAPDSPDGVDLDTLAVLISEYEDKRFPIPKPTAEEAARFRADEEPHK